MPARPPGGHPDVETAHPSRPRGRDVLFNDRRYLTIVNGTAYDVHPDGQHFLMIKGGAQSRKVVVVLNWFDRLRAGRR